MSGRSAYVRKVKVDKSNKAGYDYLNKDDTLKTKEHTPSIKSDPSISEFSRGDHGDSSHFADHSDMTKSEEPSARSVHSGHYEAEYNNNPGYARIRRPEMPIIETSGIEKSAFRSKMEKGSEHFRHNLANVFKKKKGSKEDSHEAQPETPIGEKHELNEEVMQHLSNKHPASPGSQGAQYENRPTFKRAATFKGEIAPPVPAKTKIWRQKGQPAVLWDKFDVRDPDLWNFKGDVLVFFSREDGENATPQPVFRFTSLSLDNMGSPLIDALLREGITDELETKTIADSYQNDSNSPKIPTPPGSESSRSFDASQISYIITLPAAGNIEGQELLRYKLSWRNVFAVYYDRGIVGYTLHQAMIDMHERYLTIMPRNQTLIHIPVGYTNRMGRFDLRNDPESACSMLIWSEHKKIRWQKGWHEAFAHCAGMYNQVTLLPGWKNVSPTTKLMLDKASVEISTKVAYCEGLLANFDYGSYWPESSSFQSVSSREAFFRLQSFFRDYYSYLFETWPPAPPASKNVDGWLTRIIVKTLAADFFALYDYLVDRRVIWSDSAEMNSRRTILIRPGSPQFCPDTDECEFTSLIERFDNHHNFPSIPHPYPKLPGSPPPPTRGRFTPLEARKCALSYTEATNIFVLGDDYVGNDLVEQYMQWEKTDRIGECDPRSARRARWVLIYFILQTLSTLVVETPALAYSDEVEYFLSGKVEQQPFWIDDQFLRLSAEHDRSHCWIVPSTWKIAREGEESGVEPVPGKLEFTATGMSTSSVSSHGSVAITSTFSEAETANDLETALTSSAASVADSEASFLTMKPPNHLSIRTRDLSLDKPKSSSSAPASSRSPKSAQSQLPDTVSLFPAPPRQPIEQYHASKPSEKYYNPANHPPSLPPKSPLPETPSAYGATPRHFQNPNRNITAYGPPRVRPSPYQSPSFSGSPFPGHDGEIMGLRIYKSASSTPLPSPTISSRPNTSSERSLTGYAPGIEKIEEATWPSTGSGNGNSNGSGNTSPAIPNFRNHHKHRNAQLSGEPLFKIRDFDELA